MSGNYRSKTYPRGTGASAPGTVTGDARYAVAERISDALDTTGLPSKVETLATMSPEKRAAMLAAYPPRQRPPTTDPKMARLRPTEPIGKKR